MAYCGNCGKELADGVKFCTNCGTAADTYTEAETAENREQKMIADNLIEETFGKALASAICAGFPVASIVAIVLGQRSLENWKKATALAEKHRFRLTGKNIPTRVLALVGKIAGIAMTAFWGVYLIFLIVFVALAATL